MDNYYPVHERNPEKEGIKLFWVLGTIFVLVILGLASLFIFFPGGFFTNNSPDTGSGNTDSSTVCQEDWVCADWGECTNGYQNRSCTDSNDCGTSDERPAIRQVCSETSNPTNESNQSSTNQSEIIVMECSDWDCFIGASENCEKSNLTTTYTINFFGADITSTAYYEILGERNVNCELKIRTEEVHTTFSEEAIQQALDGGQTQEELDQALQESNDLNDLLEGREGTCEFKTDSLTYLLTELSVGNFSGGVSCSLNSSGNWDCTYSGDWELAENCEGEYFSSKI